MTFENILVSPDGSDLHRLRRTVCIVVASRQRKTVPGHCGSLGLRGLERPSIGAAERLAQIGAEFPGAGKRPRSDIAAAPDAIRSVAPAYEPSYSKSERHRLCATAARLLETDPAARPTDAIVAATRNGELGRRAFAPLLELRQQGVIRDVRYVSWDSSEVDEYVAPAVALDGVRHACRNQTRRATATSAASSIRRAISKRHLPASPSPMRCSSEAASGFRVPRGIPERQAARFRSSLRACHAHCPECRIAGVAVATENLDPLGGCEPALFLRGRCLHRPQTGYCAARRTEPRRRNAAARRRELRTDRSCSALHQPLPQAFPIFARYVTGYRAFVNDLNYRKILVPLLLGDQDSSGTCWSRMPHPLRCRFHYRWQADDTPHSI